MNLELNQSLGHARDFLLSPHVIESGEVVIHQSNHYLSFLVKVRPSRGGFLKLTNIPPARQVEQFFSNSGVNLLIVTWKDQIIVFDEQHPEGLFLELPPIRRLIVNDEQPYVIDHSNTFNRVELSISEGKIDWPSSRLEGLIEDVIPDCVSTSDGRIFILTSDSGLKIIDSGGLSSISERVIQANKVKKISGPLILYNNGKVNKICKDDGKFKVKSIINPIRDHLNYQIRDLTWCNRSTYLIDTNNHLRKLDVDGVYTGGIQRFVNEGCACVEDTHGNLLSLRELKPIPFPFVLAK